MGRESGLAYPMTIDPPEMYAVHAPVGGRPFADFRLQPVDVGPGEIVESVEQCGCARAVDVRRRHDRAPDPGRGDTRHCAHVRE